jgi:hypothetical protein
MTFDLGMRLAIELALSRWRSSCCCMWPHPRQLSGSRTPHIGWSRWWPARDLRPDRSWPRRRSLLGGSFVQDGLAIFAKRLFIASAALSVLGSLTLRQRLRRRAAEYHFALLISLLGMCVLASARELCCCSSRSS